jgi:hypothetical protein
MGTVHPGSENLYKIKYSQHTILINNSYYRMWILEQQEPLQNEYPKHTILIKIYRMRIPTNYANVQFRNVTLLGNWRVYKI